MQVYLHSTIRLLALVHNCTLLIVQRNSGHDGTLGTKMTISEHEVNNFKRKHF